LNPTSAEDPGDPYTYFIDDILITKAVEGPVTLLSSDFEDGETAPWQARGDGVSIAVTDADGHESDRSLLVSGRSDGWHGVQTPINGLFEEGKTYQVSAWVKLAEGEDPANLKFTVAEVPESYEEVNTAVEVTDAEWVQISGSYTRG